MIEIPAIDEPHQGTSYNPPLEAHTELIEKANEAAKRQANEAEKLADVKNKINMAITGSGADVHEGVASGMTVDDRVMDEEEDEEVNEDDLPLAKKAPARKTKQQKTRAARLRAEVCCST